MCDQITKWESSLPGLMVLFCLKNPSTRFTSSITIHQTMMTSSNGNIFRVTGLLCGEFTGPGEFPAQRPVTRSSDVFFDLRLNKRLSKQPWGWWFETPSWSLWRQCNAFLNDVLWWWHRLQSITFTIYIMHKIRIFSGFVSRYHIKTCGMDFGAKFQNARNVIQMNTLLFLMPTHHAL